MRRILSAVAAAIVMSLPAYAQSPCGWTPSTSTIITPCKLGVFTTTEPVSPFQVHVGTDTNYHVRAGSLWPGGSGVNLDSLNDAGTARLMMMISGNPTVFNVGNVGIGTLNPQEKLEVWGNVRVGSDFTTMPAPQYGGLSIGQYGGGAIGELQFLSAASANGYGFRFRGDASNGGFRIDNRANSTTWSDFMAFTASGNVGIGAGAMTPGSRLTVAGVVESLSGGYKFPDGTVQSTAVAVPGGVFCCATGSNVGIGTSGSALNRLHIFSATSADGISVDGSNSPAVNFRNNGSAPKAYIGLATAAGGGAWFSNTAANDLAIRSETGSIFLGRGSALPTVVITNTGFAAGGLRTPEAFINTDNWFKPAAAGTFASINSDTSEAVINAISKQDANGAHLGGLYFTRSLGQIDAHLQVAAIQARQAGTGNLSGGELWFFTKGNGGGAGADAARMLITSDGKVVIGTPGQISATSALNVVGDINVSGNINAKYQDVAEWVDARGDLEPGTVVVLDPTHDDQVMPSASSYDTAVAGVVSANPGLILGTGASGKEKIATTGRVKVRVDATRAPIRIGDLLVTSDVPGTAMRSDAVDVGGVRFHRPGTVIGKALQALPAGRGEILVLLSMQ